MSHAHLAGVSHAHLAGASHAHLTGVLHDHLTGVSHAQAEIDVSSVVTGVKIERIDFDR